MADRRLGPARTITGRFRNPWKLPSPRGLASLLLWSLRRWFLGLPADSDPDSLPRARPEAGRPLSDGALAVTWLGHSTVLLEAGGRAVLTDPVWGDRVSPFPTQGPRRRVPPPLALEALPRLDLVLVSHNHYDHLDRPTVERLAALQPEAEWVAPLGVGALLRRFGVRLVRECTWWGQLVAGGVQVACTPARHFSARGILDRYASLWCGWSVAMGGRRVYFAGDTAYHPSFAEIAGYCGPFDLVLLPIGAYEPRWFMEPVHLSPEEAVRAYGDLCSVRPEAAVRPAMVGIHWGTYKLSDEPMHEPPNRTRAAWRQAGLPDEDLWILAQGETRVLAGR